MSDAHIHEITDLCRACVREHGERLATFAIKSYLREEVKALYTEAANTGNAEVFQQARVVENLANAITNGKHLR
jgi:hypothetical protein